jgi:aryl-alcohol dehydrogenase-like predicted oxidoreductase
LSPLARIGLGTAQFGFDYGISNRNGRPSESEVAAILARAVEAGVGYLDTAASYADAEGLIGRHLPSHHSLRVATKLPQVKAETIDRKQVELVRKALAHSLERLRMARVHAVLIHSVRDLVKPGWQALVEALRRTKDQGLASRIGVSIYNDSDLDLVWSRLKPDLVQFPLNVLDHRLVESGRLSELKASGIELHARSVFLQGLLLMPVATLPSFFEPVRAVLANLHERWAVAKLSPLSACLHSVLANPQIDAAIVGVNRLHEFDEIVAAVSGMRSEARSSEPIGAIDPLFLDPRRWPEAGR